jgi:hypothetical protein
MWLVNMFQRGIAAAVDVAARRSLTCHKFSSK